MTPAQQNVETRLRHDLAELGEGVEVSPDAAWSRIQDLGPRRRHRRRTARTLVPALGLAILIGFVVAAIVVSRDDASDSVIATEGVGEVEAVGFDLKRVPAGYVETPDEGFPRRGEAPRVACERWRPQDDEPICEALIGATSTRYETTAAPSSHITVSTSYGRKLEDLDAATAESLTAGGDVTRLRVRGHEARQVSSGSTESGMTDEVVFWEESPGVVVSVSSQYDAADPLAERPDVRRLARAVVARPLPKSLQYVVARGSIPYPLPGPEGSQLSYRWFVTTSLGNPRDPCAWLVIARDPIRGTPLDASGDCVVVPPDEPLLLLTDPDDGGFDESDDTVVLFGVARSDVVALEVVSASVATPVDLIESPGDFGYSFFATPVGANSTAVLRAYGKAGRPLGEIEALTP